MPTPVLPSGEQVELSHGDQCAVVVEVGGSLRSYAVGDWEVLDGYAQDEMCTSARAQILVPWPNRLRDGRYAFAGAEHQLPLTEPAARNAIHGLVRWASWAVAERESDRVVMAHRLYPRDGYPFALELAIEYLLSDAGLSVRLTAANAGAEPCPVGAGAHPYLRVGPDRIDGATLRAPGAVRMLSDDRGIPTGTEPVQGSEYDFRAARPLGTTQLDTGYAELERGGDGLARVELSAPEAGRHVALWQDAAYPYLMLFTGDSLPDAARRRHGLGVEPMTCAPNALRSGDGLRVLAPGESLHAAWGIATG